MENKKMYMLDTSVILDDPNNIFILEDKGENLVFINNVVYGELNNKKKSDSKAEAPWNARKMFRLLNNETLTILSEEEVPSEIGEQFKKHMNANGDKCIRYHLKSKEGDEATLYMIRRANFSADKKEYFETEKNDVKISEIALDYGMVLVTNDAGLYMDHQLSGGKAEFLINNYVKAPEAISFRHEERVMKGEGLDHSALSDYAQIEKIEMGVQEDGTEFETGIRNFYLKINGGLEELDLSSEGLMSRSILSYRNNEQAMYYALLKSKAPCVVVSGATGSGKTLLAVIAGIEMVKSGEMDGIIYTRNTVTANDASAELGFRKGGEDVKLGYFMYPLFSAINVIIEHMKKEPGGSLKAHTKYAGETNSFDKNVSTEAFMKENCIEIMDIAHLRGVSIKKKFVIIDESQNMTPATMKLIGTRMGEDSRIIVMGDGNQIDHPFLTKNRNALAAMLALAKTDDYIAGIRLTETVRSALAEWFDKAL